MRQHRQGNSGIFACDDWRPGSNSGFKKAVRAGFKKVFQRCLRLLLSDFPVDYGHVRSVPIGAFNSKRAPWNSWYNVPVFLRAWRRLIEDQRCLSYDWTVKVDMVP